MDYDLEYVRMLVELCSKGENTVSSSSWSKVLDVAEAISNQSENIEKMIKLAMTDTDILGENSKYCRHARDVFGDRFIEWIDEDTESESVPYAAFKTTMYGAGL